MTNIEELNVIFSHLSLDTNKVKAVIKIQSWFRGCIFRLKRLPMVMYVIQNYLTTYGIEFCKVSKDGRTNSCLDENNIKNILTNKFTKRVKIAKERHWYDILLYDYKYGWIPINIKTTTTLTCDNIGNLSICVYALTNEVLELGDEKSYNNGDMSRVLIRCLIYKEYNFTKKDYYFLVLNKTNSADIIINSLRGLTVLTPNANNLPFQICWNKNRTYQYENIYSKIARFIKCLQKPAPSWKEEFMTKIRSIIL